MFGSRPYRTPMIGEIAERLFVYPADPLQPSLRAVPSKAQPHASCLRGTTGLLLLLAACCVCPASYLTAAEIDSCRDQFVSGKFSECIQTAQAALENRKYGEDWPVLKAEAESAIGEYATAVATVDSGLKRYSWSVRLRLVGYHASQFNGDAKRAQQFLDEVNELAGRSPWRYTDVDDLVALGQAALILGADARSVLEVFFDRAKKYNPKRREPYLASANLALTKNDHALAAEVFQEAFKQFPDDPDVQFGLARSLASLDAKRAALALERTLTLNPNHAAAMLLKANRAIDAEDYAQADVWLDRVLAVNPHHTEAWAQRAVVAHLTNDMRGEALFRAAALSRFKTNPHVDHLIGTKLSQNYRFAEGAAYQRRALVFDEKYLPARIQLAQDLLRLGQEDEGWSIAHAAHESDGYDVTTFNLAELRDKLTKFRTLEDDDFIVRMDAREAAVYGHAVLDVLHRAKDVLTKKYGFQLTHKITVEIFPDQNDFAVRTFGMPAVSGYLGVCFGKVITANSPASQAENPSNWQAVLWHEFCHVITLEMTHNRIPRWLSEGISVYEELQANPTWGQQMNPQYRKMVLEGELTPIGELSSAFHAPPSGLHLQFAYYESALAVEFLVEHFGLAALKNILGDLGAGLPINTALERHTVALPQLTEEFASFVKERAEQLAPAADWEEHDFADLLNDDADVFSAWIKEHPNHYVGLSLAARKYVEEKQFDQAKPILQKLVELYPNYTGGDGPRLVLAGIHRELNETEQEHAVLEAYAAVDDDALTVYLRLLELGKEAGDWQAVLRNAQRTLSVNPLIAEPHRALAQAAEQLQQPDTAIQAYQALLALDPGDPAEVNFQLARLLHQQQRPDAKRHVLAALEEAPRFRAAHRLLLQITRRQQ